MGISVSNGEFYGILRGKYIELTSQHFSFYRKLLVMFPNDRGSTVNSRESDRPLPIFGLNTLVIEQGLKQRKCFSLIHFFNPV